MSISWEKEEEEEQEQEALYEIPCRSEQLLQPQQQLQLQPQSKKKIKQACLQYWRRHTPKHPEAILRAAKR
jgi:hypothetical protein